MFGLELFAFAFCVLHFFFPSSHAFQLFYETKITVHALFTEPTVTLFKKYILKMGPIILFTHLKIILL